MFDYLIVGQGLAGTWLSHYLLALGQKVAVIDQYKPHSASRIASGIMNPITGKRFVKTWQADTVLPFAQQAYQHLETQLNATFFAIKPLIWLLHQVEDLNQFNALSAEPDYAPYIDQVSTQTFAPYLQPHRGYVQIKAGCINTSVFLSAYRQYLQANGLLFDSHFDATTDLTIEKSAEYGIRWQGIQARHLIFCEGYDAVAQNPYFNWLPFSPVKGEVLYIRLLDATAIDTALLQQYLIKNGVFIMHLHDDIYWVGSNYEHHFADALPSLHIKQQLLQQLNDTLLLPYEVVEQVAAIRPASHYRRPFVGRHPQYSQLSVFNGMGTKGLSLSPYYATQLAQHLVHGKALDKAVCLPKYP
jgi:glycine/D-amino acid oxidase-like deaminating enzyme